MKKIIYLICLIVLVDIVLADGMGVISMKDIDAKVGDVFEKQFSFSPISATYVNGTRIKNDKLVDVKIEVRGDISNIIEIESFVTARTNQYTNLFPKFTIPDYYSGKICAIGIGDSGSNIGFNAGACTKVKVNVIPEQTGCDTTDLEAENREYEITVNILNKKIAALESENWKYSKTINSLRKEVKNLNKIITTLKKVQPLECEEIPVCEICEEPKICKDTANLEEENKRLEKKVKRYKKRYKRYKKKYRFYKNLYREE